jgi:nitrous oxidase accessory protein
MKAGSNGVVAMALRDVATTPLRNPCEVQTPATSRTHALPGLLASALFLLFPLELAAESLQQRIDTAYSGQTLIVAAGTYDGPIVITKPLTLRSEGDATLRGDGKSHVIFIKADHVTIEGFHLCHSGKDLDADHAGIFVTGNFVILSKNRIDDCLHGIYLKKVTDCRITGNCIRGSATGGESAGNPEDALRPDSGETCTVTALQGSRGNGVHFWNSDRIILRDNEISDMRDGVYFSFTHHSQVTGNTIRHVRFGLHYMYSDYNCFENNRFMENTAGASIMYSKGLLVRRNCFIASVGHRGYGLALTAVDTTRFEENDVTGNSTGIHMQLCHDNTFVGNNVSRGGVGIRLAASSDGNIFFRNVFAGNMHPVEIDAGTGDNTWALDGVGNQWAHGSEIDLNGDGIGDFPHREPDLLGALRRPFPLAGLLSGSPALDIVRFSQQHAALPRIAAIIDPAPLTSAFSSIRPSGGVR